MSTQKDPKLLDKVRSYLRLHHYSIHTERAYCGWIKRYVHFHILASIFVLLTLSPVTIFQAWASLILTLPQNAFQGDLVVGRVVPVCRVWTGGEGLTVSADGYFVIGVPRDLMSNIVVLAKNDEESVKRTIQVMASKWDIERIEGLPEKKVSPDPETLAQIQADSRTVNTVRSAPPSLAALFIEKGFTVPVQGRISGVFGSQRVLNGKPRSPHRGLDIAAPTGTPVIAPTDGIVQLVAEDMVLMGNTLIVDHGLGLRSIFIHLDRILVKKGDAVSQGDLIARVGQSGRATGPHLHWGVFVGTVAVDPQKVLKK